MTEIGEISVRKRRSRQEIERSSACFMRGFRLWRRKELESFRLEALGKSSTTHPFGCVIVTQVVERSADMDADFFVTLFPDSPYDK
jgi:hypothetical protein